MPEDSARAALLRKLWDGGVTFGTRVFDLSSLVIALAFVVLGATAILLVPAEQPLIVAALGIVLLAIGVPWSLWRASVARQQLGALRELYSQHDSVLADPAATRELPAVILRTEDAVDTAHLDCILARRRNDWPDLGNEGQRIAIAGALLVALTVVATVVIVAGLLGLLLSTRLFWDDDSLAVRGGLALALALPAVTLSQSAAALRNLSLTDEASQWDRAQHLLDSGALVDDGAELSVIHRGATLQLAVRRLPFAIRPQRRHFNAARRGALDARVTGIAPWLILTPLGVAIAVFASLTSS